MKSFFREFKDFIDKGNLLAIAVASAWATIEWIRRPAGRKQVEELLLRLPFIGAVRRSLATARVMRALGGMLRAGMPLLPALDAARDAAGEKVR